MLPVVRFFFACDLCVCDLADYKWSIRNPWHTVQMPPGVAKKFGQEEVWLFAQVADALGDFDFGVELRYLERTMGVGPVLCRSEVERRTFDHKLQVHELVFRMKTVPFPKPGQYQFQLMARGHVLENGFANLDVLAGEPR